MKSVIIFNNFSIEKKCVADLHTVERDINL